MHYFIMQVSVCVFLPFSILYVLLQEYTMIAIEPMCFLIRVLCIQHMSMYCLKLNKYIYLKIQVKIQINKSRKCITV